MTIYCSREIAFIDRSDGRAQLFNCDGDRLFVFPASMTDDQIYKALDFANKAHDLGFDRGKAEKTYELRQALGIRG